MTFDPTEHPHRRLNPLTGQWVLVSPHRAKRPWQGALEAVEHAKTPSYDPGCYLCPGNRRVNGETNPEYSGTYVFQNDFPALLEDCPQAFGGTHPLFTMASVQGTSRVLCFSADHSKSLPELSLDELFDVVECWTHQVLDLKERFAWVQIFENKGAAMGCSNPHPHGQVWALNIVPNEGEIEDQSQREYYQKTGTVMLLDYAQAESDAQERIIEENEHWIAVVPYWAVWPYEILLMPKKRVISHFDRLDDDEKKALGSILKPLLTRYDNLFETSFPYSMGWHGRPFDAPNGDNYWQLHAHFYPPLLRNAHVKKFMVGFEMLAESQRDLTAEQAARRLRGLSTVHYRERA